MSGRGAPSGTGRLTRRGAIAGLPVLLAASQAKADFFQDLLRTLGGAGKGDGGALDAAEIGSGLREALRVGTERVVGQVGRVDGYNNDRIIHLPLPESLRKVQSALQVAGMSGLLDDLELRLNRAAEAAAPKAKRLFWQAIADMTIDDALGIYNGPGNSATMYFQGKMSRPLAQAMQPVVDQSLAQVGAVQAYENMIGAYKSLPFVPDVRADLTAYVIEKGMDGIFYYLGKEEAAIRNNPVKRTTALLQRVFGPQ